MKNQRIIDRLWPIGRIHDDIIIKASGRGKCIRCGCCCALICIQADQEYFIEKMRLQVRWSEETGEQISANTLKWWKGSRFIIDNWIRVPHDDAVRRGIRKDVEASDFFYTCKQLKSDGTCRVHNGYRPDICIRYPYYSRKTIGNRKKATVSRECGFARVERK